MDDYLSPEAGEAQFASEDPSDEADQLQLQATIEAILENTLDDKDNKAESNPNRTDDIKARPEDLEHTNSEEPLQETSFCTKFLQEEDAHSNSEESDKHIIEAEKTGLTTTTQNEVPSISSNNFVESDLSSTTVVTSTDHIPDVPSNVQDLQDSHGDQPAKTIKHSPRKTKEKVNLNRESEIIRKKKELLEANESKTLPFKKRGRPPSSTPHSRNSLDSVRTSTTKNIAPECAINDINFFLPDGWLFYASKRMMGTSTGKFDQYYLTPGPKRLKLRSRQELIAWMKKNDKNWDVNDFFCRQSVEPLIKKGILKYISDRLVIAASTEEEFFGEGRHLPLDKSSSKKYPLPKVKQSEETEKLLKTKVKAKQSHKRKLAPKKSKLLNGRSTQRSSPIKALSLRKSSPMKEQSVQDSSFIRAQSVASSKGSMDCQDGFVEDEQPVISQTLSPASQPQSSNRDEQRVIIRNKPKIFRSPYFTLNDGLPEKPLSIAALSRNRDDKGAPPRSPYNLIQEDLFHNPWQLLVSTIFLNCTSGKLAIPLATEFLSRWPTPQDVCRANIYEILNVVEPLGFGRTRAAQLIRFSYEFLTKDWKFPRELYGIGKYGNDSYKIFCLQNEWKQVVTDDPLLMMYLNWRRATEHLRKKFLNCPGDPMDVDPDEIPIQPPENHGEVPRSQNRQIERDDEASSQKRKSFMERSGPPKRGRKRKRRT